MNNTFTELQYTIAGNNNRILCYMSEEFCNSLTRIPREVVDAISSVGISFPSTDIWYFKGHKLTAKDKEDIVFRKMYEVILQYWKWEYGIPAFRFEGATKQFGQGFSNRTIFIFTLFPDIDVNVQITAWKNVLSFVSKFTFIAGLNTNAVAPFSISTSDHRVAFSYLEGLGANDRQKSNFTRYNLEKIIKDWEPDDTLRNALDKIAHETIMEFIYIKKLNLFVPGHLFFTSINIRRYRRAFEILTNKYQPKFIMTLPFTYQGRQYTVAFPICGKV